MSELVQVTRAEGVCEIRLNRPEKRNALNRAMYVSLGEALAAAEADESTRVVLLSGEGACFTAGNDLQDFLDPAVGLGAGHPTVRFMHALPRFPKVLVAAVHGPTVGIGVTLLLHCDLVVAAAGTQLSMPFVRLGLVPELGSSLLLPRLTGAQRAAELLLLGRPLGAEEALGLGLVNRVVAEGQLIAEARALAGELSRQPPHALREAKRLLRGDVTSIDERIDAELEVFKAQLASAEFRAAIEAVLRRPRSPS